MTSRERKAKSLRGLVESVERGLDQLTTDPTVRLRTLRKTLEAQQREAQRNYELTSKETVETLEQAREVLVKKYPTVIHRVKTPTITSAVKSPSGVTTIRMKAPKKF